MDQEANSFGTWEQQVAADPWKRSKPLEQKDDNVAEKAKVECELQKLRKIDRINQDQSEGAAAVDEQVKW